jgi:hypothetical protein
MRGERLHRRGSRNREDQEKPRPESARHLATLKGGEFARISPWCRQAGGQLAPFLRGLVSISCGQPMRLTVNRCEGDCTSQPA